MLLVQHDILVKNLQIENQMVGLVINHVAESCLDFVDKISSLLTVDPDLLCNLHYLLIYFLNPHEAFILINLWLL